ncbi:MAG: hypothetical protein ACJ72E_13665 [Marmoricola sp.]
MTCGECKNNEKHLYQRTVHGRLTGTTRRTKRTLASAAALGLMASGALASLSPATASPDFSGFSSFAQATPLRIEVHEPAIPVPSDPELELNFSYTKVNGSSGPTGTARASAMWPGDAVGEGLKTFGEQLGLPGALTDGGYPVQINAQSPGDTAAATQEFFPGMTGKVTTSDKAAIAKVGYGTSGDVAEGDSGAPTATPPPNPLAALASGDLSALTNLLTGSHTAGPGEGAPSSSPLGALGLLVSAGGMDSVSRTTYDTTQDAVVATSTARLGSIGLLAGIVKLDGVEVVTQVTSNQAKGAVVTRKVTIGAMTIAGNKFGLTGDGIEAMGKATPIPGLPDAPAAALKALGITITPGVATVTKNGAAGSVTAEGLRITIETAPLLNKLPKLPIADLVSKLPDLPGQASILKGLIIALGQATPRVDLVLGQSTSQAQTVPGFDDGTTSPPTTTVPGTGPTSSGSVPPSSVGPVGAEQPPAASTPPTVTPGITNINKLASGLPDIGGLPTWLALIGLAIAGGAGWYIWRAGSMMFGGAAICTHGLKSGIPDLRKV